MFRKYAQILVVLSSLMCGMHAFARPAQPGDELNAFFNRVIEASSQRTCEATEAALARIPDAEFERAQVLMQSLGADDLDAVHKKIDQIIAKTASCPGAQDAFASRLSRLALQAHLKPGAAPQARVEVLRQFVTKCWESIIPDDCAGSANRLKSALSSGLCTKSVAAFKAVSPDSLSDADHDFITNRLTNAIEFASSCEAYSNVYRACLGNTTTNHITADSLKPFIQWLSEVEKIAANTKCEDIYKTVQSIDPKIVRDARRVAKSVSLPRLTEQSRQDIKTRMQRIYHAAEHCKDGTKIIDDVIEVMFAN